jgi:hypothetical protein
MGRRKDEQGRGLGQAIIHRLVCRAGICIFYGEVEPGIVYCIQRMLKRYCGKGERPRSIEIYTASKTDGKNLYLILPVSSQIFSFSFFNHYLFC